MEENGNTQPEKPENPSPTSSNEEEVKQEEEEEEEAPLEQEPPPPPSASRRAPFTSLSQVDADLALARTLQEQERAYMMLRMNSQVERGGSDFGSYFPDEVDDDEDDDFNDPETDNDDVENDNANNDTNNTNSNVNNEEGQLHDSDHDEDKDETDAFDAHVHHDDEDGNLRVAFDPAVFTSDEAYARALQDAEERDMAASLFALAGIHDVAGEVVEREDHSGNSQEMWEEVDPDELSYEELLALGEVVGTESRGLSSDTIASLPSIKYKTGSNQNGSNDSCVICRLDYEDGENLTLLSCNHSYHSECINDWLKINKVCPVCSTEVSTSCHS